MEYYRIFIGEKMKKKELRVIIPEELYRDFKKKCKLEYKTISEVIRDFMVKYSRGK